MKKIIYLIFLAFLINNCSFDNKTGIWTGSKNILKKKDTSDQNIELIFKKENEILKDKNLTLNQNIKLGRLITFKNWTQSYQNKFNSIGNVLFFNEGNYKKLSKISNSKINKSILVNNNNLFFSDFNGNIGVFSLTDNKVIYKFNFYKKKFKKTKKIIKLIINKGSIVAADNLANYYALNLENGNLLWKFRNSVPFNSQVKIYEDKIFVIDFENILRCYSLKNGKELWNFKTEKSFIKSQQKLSLIIYDRAVIFNNTLGDITSVDIETGNLIWQTPTQSNTIYENAFSLKSSDLVLENSSIFFSNNKNEFFAINVNNGQLIWKNNINSNLRPTIIDNLVVTVSMEGFLIITDSSNGNIIRITNIFDRFNNKKKQIKPTGFVVAKNKIYISLNNGKLIIANILDGKSLDTIKIDGDKISRPYILSKNLYVIKDNAILKIN